MEMATVFAHTTGMIDGRSQEGGGETMRPSTESSPRGARRMRGIRLPLAFIVIFAMGLAASQLVASRGHAADGGSDDIGPPDHPEVLTERTDLDAGLIWRLVTYPSMAGTCVDILADTLEGDLLGGPGACGPEVDAAMAASDSEEPLVSGNLYVSLIDGSVTTYAVSGGPVSCSSCLVTIHWSDGASTVDLTTDGLFVSYHDVGPGGVATVTSIETDP
jgi:hypothetical protein